MFVIAIAVQLIKGDHIDWQEIAVFAGLLVLVAGLLWLRIYRTLAKTAKTISASCNSLTIDASGLAVESTNGTRTSIPWSAVGGWREGKLVFTIGDSKSFRIVPKASLGPMQSDELRSLLLAQIRSTDPAYAS